MRLFIGIRLPKEINEILHNIQKRIGNKDAKIKWVFKKNLHLTLKFIGNVEEHKLEQIKKKLRGIIMEPMELSLDEIGVFSHGEVLRVIWVGIQPEKLVMDLQKKIDSEMLELGFDADTKFSAHLTLGRVKFVKKEKELFDKITKIKLNKSKFGIMDFCLIESKLTKDGPKYEVIERYS